MDVLLRLAVLGVLTYAAWAAVSWYQRRLRASEQQSDPGVTVFTGPDCSLCGPLVHALRRLGIAPRIIDVTDGTAPPAGVRSLPTVLVADGTGRVVLRRSGRAALDDVITIAGFTPGRARLGSSSPIRSWWRG